jgi:hypothetical protein
MNALEQIKKEIESLTDMGIEVKFLVMTPSFERSLFIDGFIPKNKSVEGELSLQVILSEQVEKYNFVV